MKTSKIHRSKKLFTAMNYNVVTYVTRIINVTEMQEFNKLVGLDLSFQSWARWPEKQKSAYITSLIMGMAPSKIIVANIEKCIENFSEDSYDYKYFQGWRNQGKIAISIDGNNRTIAIDDFLKGKVSLIHGEYNLSTGVVLIDSTNDRFTKLPQSMLNHIRNNVNLTICEYQVASRSDLSDLFKNINNGVSLNAQELRNAFLVEFAKSIRELSEKHKDAFKYIAKAKNNKRRAIDEQFVTLAVYYARGADRDISKSSKDEAYLDNSSISKQFYSKGKKVIEETMEMIKKYADAGFKDVSTLLNFFMAVDYLHKNDYSIIDKEEFFKWFMRTENSRLGNRKVLAVTKEGENRSYSGCNLSTSDPFLKARYDYIVKDLESIPKEISCKLDNERQFTFQDRYDMWKRQNGVCTLTGKIIPEHEINNHKKWQADHIHPYAHGGPTEMYNAQLICIIANQQKSAKLNYQSQEVAA